MTGPMITAHLVAGTILLFYGGDFVVKYYRLKHRKCGSHYRPQLFTFCHFDKGKTVPERFEYHDGRISFIHRPDL